MTKVRRVLFVLFLFVFTGCFADGYEVKFEGTEDASIISTLMERSDLVKLQERSPGSDLALRHRAEDDVARLVDALHSMAYYNARVEMKYDFSQTPAVVIVNVETGPIYPLNSFKILPESLKISPEDLDLALPLPALPGTILEAEKNLIYLLKKQGHPLAKIVKRSVVADQSTKQINVTIEVEAGPLAYFGPATIKGNDDVLEIFIRNKIYWCEGEEYDPDRIDLTLAALESTGLFKSIAIIPADDVLEGNILPIEIDVSESKHRSIAFGVCYSTQRGAGVTLEWSHRNLFSMGEKLFFEANILQKTQELKLNFLKPDFLMLNQDLVSNVELKHDVTEGYTERSGTIGAALERQLTKKSRVSLGITYKQLQTSDSDNNGSFSLLKTPFQYKLNNTDDLLDPTTGYSLFFRTVPTFQFLNGKFFYEVNQFIGSAYYPVKSDGSFVIASKINVGSILGAPEGIIPTPERFFAGSESTLRGYKYYTVSPYEKHEPIGGRSMIIYTLEGRWKLTDTWGAVLFMDAGNVYRPAIPNFNKRLLKSFGVGARYYTPVGPLRLDVAFPLNKRPGKDNSFQLYFSVGQSF